MTSTASTSGAKISMFSAKSGFVIPKNKLSGSLIPIFQRGKTLGGSDSANGLLPKLGKRKTKWGPDLTQDSAVKKGRVLAYQKRLDQITQQLESGTHEAENDKESALASQKDSKSSLPHKNNSNIAEHLEFEKREVIGEILDLNPRYKAPPDYKPVMKEARLLINVKEHSDFSFLSVILSSQGDTLKRLEKETGAKVQIFGTKNGGEKVELSPSNENEIQMSWLELYFQISSDTYEKVDAAIAVIELLISSVSGNTVAGPAPQSSESEGISTIPGNSNATATDPTSEQATDSSVQPPQSQFEQHGSSFPLASNQVPFYPPHNPSAPNLDHRIQDQELPTNAVNPNPLNVQQPLPIPHNTSLPPGSQVPRPSDLFPFSLSSTSGDFSMVAPQGSSSHLGFSTPPPCSQILQPIGPRSTMRPSTLFTFQPVPNNVLRPTPLPDLFSSNMVQPLRPLAPNFNSHPVAHQSGIERPSVPFPSSVNLKHLVESFGGSLSPMSAHIGGRPTGPIPTYPSANTAPRPFLGDFGFLPRLSNIARTLEISPRLNSQPAHLPHLSFRAPSITPASQHFGQSFTRQQQFGRQMDQPPNHLPAPFHDSLRSNLQNFGPPLPQMMSRNFQGTQFPQNSAHFPPRPVFRHDNLNPSGQPQFLRRFNTGANQVYDPFSPSDG